MQRLELVVVQLEEVKRLIEVGRVPQLRLAHILLDSAVELIMHRMIQSELRHERYHFDKLENLRRLQAWRHSDDLMQRRFAAAGPSDDDLDSEIRQFESQVTSKGRRKKIDRVFADKIDFLVERQLVPEVVGPALKKLHDYRNETYHQDRHRSEVIRPAVLVYFDVACTVLECYRPDTMIIDRSCGPELTRFQDDSRSYSDPLEIPQRAARMLRQELNLDLEAVRTALVSHLLGRLHDLESGLEYNEESSQNHARPGDAIRLMQIEDGDVEAIFDDTVLRSRNYPLTMTDVESWIERATAMEGFTDQHALLKELAALEDAFEGIEQQVRRAVWEIDEAANMR